MLKTLAAKHGSTVTKMARKYRASDIPLKRHKNAVLDDRQSGPVTIRRKELITRLRTGQRE